ncbi:zinc finger protein 501 [Folsomia candida]|uniref:zinc finger protein 501 n=1 Tax=Folsomia candida TaxID=158441 RepID=UPI000B908EE5|nr:zinc finger protein 501 [Folsomia candida]
MSNPLPATSHPPSAHGSAAVHLRPVRKRTTRSSPRGKKSVTTTPETLALSLGRIDSPIKKSYPSSSDNEKPELGDKDYVPKTENEVPVKPSSVEGVKLIPCLEPSCTPTFRTPLYTELVREQCKICKNKFHGKLALGAHMVIRHEDGEKKLSCVKCGKKFCLEENLARHLKLHEVEGVKPLVCNVCDDRFENEEKLQRHVEIHGPKFQCQYCERKFHHKLALQSHERSHTGEKPEKCSLCEAAFAKKMTLQRHMIRDHSSTISTAQNTCLICGKRFHLRCDLNLHLDQHEGRYQVKCDTCGLMFLNAKTLLAHGDKMHGKDLIICDEYGRSFTSTQTLQEHKRIHTAVKKHKCETCGARFRRADVLTKHILTHTDERPYPCPNCKKVFKAKADLLRHVKVVHTQATSLPPRTNVPTAMKNVKPLPSDVTSAKRTQECGPSPATSEQKDSRSSRR